MTTPISKFRSAMTKFLSKLDEWAKTNHHQQKELEKFKMKYDMGMRVNPRDSLAFFVETIEQHASHILKGDDEYFLGNHIDIDDEYNALNSQLKLWWPDLKDHQKNYIKNTFKLLLMLSAIAIKHEGLRKIINKYRTPDNQLIY